MTKKREQHPAPGDDASAAEAASGRFGRDDQGEGHLANTTACHERRLDLGRLRLKIWSKSDFLIAETTGPTYLEVY